MKSGNSTSWQVPKFVERTRQARQGIVGLGLYYFDLVTSVVVLVQVWGTWPGIYLLVVFFFHYAMTGFVVAYQGMTQVDTKRGAFRWSHMAQRIVVATLASPIMVFVVLLLDTFAFMRAVASVFAVSYWLESLWFKITSCCVVSDDDSPTCLKSCHCFYLSWIDLERYESMHNAVAALHQTVPTIVLNSVIFGLGNKPSHGVFISDSLFVRAAVCACCCFWHC